MLGHGPLCQYSLPSQDLKDNYPAEHRVCAPPRTNSKAEEGNRSPTLGPKESNEGTGTAPIACDWRIQSTNLDTHHLTFITSINIQPK